VTVGARIVETLWRARRDSRRYGRTEQGSCSGPFGLTTTDAGFALLDVVVAITVLMVVLLPIAYLLSTTGKVQASNQERLTAQSLAASWLEQERTVAEQSTSGPPATLFPPTGTTSTAWPVPPNPTNALPPTSETVGSIAYDVYLAGGWCAYAGANMPWTSGSASTTSASYAAAPLSYFIAVKVKWGPARANVNQIGLNDGQVVEYSSIPSQSGWEVSVSGTLESVLTLTTTTGIQFVPITPPITPLTNYCPLGLS
jgi:hypothetical protein